MFCVDSYALNKNVFSLFLNVSIDWSSVRSSAGRLFHTQGLLGQRSDGYTLSRNMCHISVSYNFSNCRDMPCALSVSCNILVQISLQLLKLR